MCGNQQPLRMPTLPKETASFGKIDLFSNARTRKYCQSDHKQVPNSDALLTRNRITITGANRIRPLSRSIGARGGNRTK